MRRAGELRLKAVVLTAARLLPWLVLRLESPAWRAALRDRHIWYPHINSSRPRPGDPLRYVLQTLWLLLVRPIRRPRRNWHWHPPAWSAKLRQRAEQSLAALNRTLVALPQKAYKARAFRKAGNALQRGRDRQSPVFRGVAGFVVAFLAIMCTTVPMAPATRPIATAEPRTASMISPITIRAVITSSHCHPTAENLLARSYMNMIARPIQPPGSPANMRRLTRNIKR